MFTRLPFGICSTQDVFQSIMSAIFEDIEGVETLVDDLLIWGRTDDEHDAQLKEVLERAKSHNLKLNKEKSQIKLKEVRYAGLIIGEKGLKADPKKVDSILKMKTPTNTQGH